MLVSLLVAGFASADARLPLNKTVMIGTRDLKYDPIEMPTINLGTNGKNDPTTGIPLWFKYGGTGIDTADVYGSQTVIAPQVADVPRDSFFITSKIPVGQVFGGTVCSEPDASLVAQYGKKITSELGLDFVDLLLLHFPCDDDRVNRMYWQAMIEARDAGVARAIGVSNYNATQLQALGSDVTPAVNQCEFNVQKHDDETIAYCEEHGVQYEAYHVLKGCPFDEERVTSVAASHGVSAAQVCLRYALEKGVVLAAGTGKDSATIEGYTQSDLGIYDFALTEDEFTSLDGIAQGQQALV